MFAEPEGLLRRASMTTHPNDLRRILQEACDQIASLRRVNTYQAEQWAQSHAETLELRRRIGEFGP
jgi:hypothetical protein